MSVLDGRIRLRAGADAIEPILHVVAALISPRFDGLARIAEFRINVVAALCGHCGIRSVPDAAVAVVAVEHLRREHDGELAVIDDGVHDVRGFPVRNLIDGPVRDGGLGPRHVHDPVHEPELVGAKVGHDASRVIPEPPPREIAVTVKGNLRRLAEKRVPVNPFRLEIRRRSKRVAFRPVTTVADAYPAHCAKRARVHLLLHSRPVRVGTVLVADLDDSAGPFDCLDHLLTFPDGVGKRLFLIDILPGFDGVNEVTMMPVVGAGDDHRVDVAALEKLPIVLVRIRFSAGNLLCLLCAEIRHIRDGRDGFAEPQQMPDVVLPSAADADDAHADLLSGPENRPNKWRRHRRQSRRRPLCRFRQKTPSCHFVLNHGVFLLFRVASRLRREPWNFSHGGMSLQVGRLPVYPRRHQPFPGYRRRKINTTWRRGRGDSIPCRRECTSPFPLLCQRKCSEPSPSSGP